MCIKIDINVCTYNYVCIIKLVLITVQIHSISVTNATVTATVYRIKDNKSFSYCKRFSRAIN